MELWHCTGPQGTSFEEIAEENLLGIGPAIRVSGLSGVTGDPIFIPLEDFIHAANRWVADHPDYPD